VCGTLISFGLEVHNGMLIIAIAQIFELHRNGLRARQGMQTLLLHTSMQPSTSSCPDNAAVGQPIAAARTDKFQLAFNPPFPDECTTCERDGQRGHLD